MRILVVTNLYPPHHIGGYELGCRDVVEHLRARGHAVGVLTSSFQNGELEIPPEETGVKRLLQCNLEPSAPSHDKRAECRKLTRVVREFDPDLVYVWNLAGLCLWLPFAARWAGCPTAFFLSDTNFISWRVAAWLAGAAAKSAALRAVFGETFLVRGWPIMRHQSCHFASEFLRNCATKAGIAVAPACSMVAHWGINLSQFSAHGSPRWPLRRLLYAGQLIPQKGVHTAITALGLLATEPGFTDLTLTIAGGGLQPDYEKSLRILPAQLGISNRVQFLGQVPRAELPRIYAEHDILVFPSEWEEPFAITPLEAMAAGLAVVGTITGGSGELFRDRVTAMTFAPGDAKDCARAIRELCADRALCESISRQGRREVESNYTLDLMIDRIEASLARIAGNLPSLPKQHGS